MPNNPLQNITDLFAAPPEKRFKNVQVSSHYLTMRDGTQIAMDVMLPADAPDGTRFPTLMVMARYWRSFQLRVPDRPNKALIGPREPIPDDMLARGFAVVLVDGRGSGASTGVSRHPWTPEELADYGEVAAWIQAQTWSNGNIGAFGISYEGSTAQYLLTSGVDGVKAVVPMEYEWDVYVDIALPGGVFNAAFMHQWNASNNLLDHNKVSSLFPFTARLFVKGARPVDSDKETREIFNQALRDHEKNTDVFTAMSNITYREDTFGDTGATLDDFSVFRYQAQIEASGGAMLVTGSWLDGTTADTVLRAFNTLNNPQIGLIGAWKHEMTAHGSPYMKSNSKSNPRKEDQWAMFAQFFQQALVDNQPITGKTLFYYTLGEETWKRTDAFPLPNTQMETWHFHAGNVLAPGRPAEADASDTYTVDFEATTGTKNRWHTQMANPVVYKDRAKADQRLLTYTSAPLTRDMEITGYPVVTLYVASSTEDSAFFVYLEEVDERGVVRYITEGQLRGLHRTLSDTTPPHWIGVPYHTFSRDDAAPLPKNDFVEITFGLHPTSVLIRRGHRVRVAIGGADKDTFARIPQTGTPTWTLSRGDAMPSRIVLPVIPRQRE